MKVSARIRACVMALGVGAALTVTTLIPVGPAAAAGCAPMDDPIYHRVNPTTGTSLLTPNKAEADAAAAHGLTQDLGIPFLASTTPQSGLIAVHRLYNATNVDWVWIPAGSEVTGATKYGYVDQGVDFYAPLATGQGCTPVYRYVKSGKHRFAQESARASLEAAGWKAEGVRFYGAPSTQPPAGTDTKFSLAVIPDTQREVGTIKDTRFAGRTAWLAANKATLDLQFVLHTGDVVNWGWLVPSQYAMASSAMKNLEAAGIPYALSVGNHDTRAVGWDGVAGSTAYGGYNYSGNPECPQRLGASQCVSELLVRHTEEFNQTFPASRFSNLRAEFEPGKADNNYSTFSAGGKNWLVLTLEFTPRTAVVNWAKEVVASHPTYNVIVQTHYYMDGNGTISPSNAGYGSNSGKYLYDNLISVYPNIKMVFCGHIGDNGYREDIGKNGNKIASYLLNGPTDNTNPVRLVEVDTSAGTLTAKVYSPATNTTRLPTTTTGMSFV